MACGKAKRLKCAGLGVALFVFFEALLDFKTLFVFKKLLVFEFLLARVFVLFWFFEVDGRDIIRSMIGQCMCRRGLVTQGILIPRYRL